MSPYLFKSEQNIQAAKYLIEGNFYSSSIHCAYYSCIQNMFNLLTNKLGYQLADIDNEAQRKLTGSHVTAINIVKNRMIEKGIRFKLGDFNNAIMYLKNNRVKADYKEDIISKELGEEAIKKATIVNKILSEINLTDDK